MAATAIKNVHGTSGCHNCVSKVLHLLTQVAGDGDLLVASHLAFQSLIGWPRKRCVGDSIDRQEASNGN